MSEDQIAAPSAERIAKIRARSESNYADWTHFTSESDVVDLLSALDAAVYRAELAESDRQRDAYEAGERLYAAERRAEVAEAALRDIVEHSAGDPHVDDTYFGIFALARAKAALSGGPAVETPSETAQRLIAQGIVSPDEMAVVNGPYGPEIVRVAGKTQPHQHDWFSTGTDTKGVRLHLCRGCSDSHHPWGMYGEKCDGCGVLAGPDRPVAVSPGTPQPDDEVDEAFARDLDNAVNGRCPCGAPPECCEGCPR